MDSYLCKIARLRSYYDAGASRGRVLGGASRFPGQGTEFVADTVEADAELDVYPMASESIECVVCFQVLEHLAGDPMHLIAESNRILKKGGLHVADDT